MYVCMYFFFCRVCVCTYWGRKCNNNNNDDDDDDDDDDDNDA